MTGPPAASTATAARSPGNARQHPTPIPQRPSHTAWPGASLAQVVILTVIPQATTAPNQTGLNRIPAQPGAPETQARRCLAVALLVLGSGAVIPQSVAAAAALLSSDDFGSSVERTVKLHPLWQTGDKVAGGCSMSACSRKTGRALVRPECRSRKHGDLSRQAVRDAVVRPTPLMTARGRVDQRQSPATAL
jgi:hypothetical protein